jgi:hypothetical protein
MPRGDYCGRRTHPHSWNILRLSAECHVETAHPRCVDVLAIRKIASMKDDRLETHVLQASTAADETHHHKALYL